MRADNGQAPLFAYRYRMTEDEDGRSLVTFPEFPEAATDGATAAEAAAEAADCLSMAIATRIKHDEPVPDPVLPGRNEHQTAPDPIIVMKLALSRALRDRGIRLVELARRLGVDEKEARRIADPYHNTNVERMSAALAALGFTTALAIYDSSRQVRSLAVPTSAGEDALRAKAGSPAFETADAVAESRLSRGLAEEASEASFARGRPAGSRKDSRHGVPPWRDTSRTIHVVERTNPKTANTKAYAQFALLERFDGRTVAEFVEAAKAATRAQPRRYHVGPWWTGELRYCFERNWIRLT